jgi:hypothetical protein
MHLLRIEQQVDDEQIGLLVRKSRQRTPRVRGLADSEKAKL